MSSWKSIKRKWGGTLPALLVMVAFVLCAPTFILLWNGIGGFVAQREQADWITTDATVVDVEEQATYSNQPGHASRRTGTEYEVCYEYVVNGAVYHGDFRDNDERKVGESLTIKYDPDTPEYSTEKLEPLKDAVKNITVGGVLGVVVIIVFVTANVMKRRKMQRD